MTALDRRDRRTDLLAHLGLSDSQRLSPSRHTKEMAYQVPPLPRLP